jgi:hypothetical protein
MELGLGLVGLALAPGQDTAPVVTASGGIWPDTRLGPIPIETSRKKRRTVGSYSCVGHGGCVVVWMVDG